MKPWAWVLLGVALVLFGLPLMFWLLGTVFFAVRVAIAIAIVVFVAGLILRMLGVKSG